MRVARPKLTVLAYIAISVIVLDLASKAVALDNVPPDGLILLPVLNFRISFNPGISFGLLAEGSIVFVAVLTSAILGVLVFLGIRAEAIAERIGSAFITGGGVANLIDRVLDGVVTDFVDMHAAGWHFPTFNLADVAITMGTVCWVLGGFSGFDRMLPSEPS